MEVARLVAFAFGVYLAGGLFALVAAWVLARLGLPGAPWRRIAGRAPPLPATPIPAAVAPRRQAPSAAPDVAPAAAPTRMTARPAPPLERGADDEAVSWLDATVPEASAVPAEPDAPELTEAPRPNATVECALTRERDEALGLRAALELELSELAPLHERLAWLARRVVELETREVAGDAGPWIDTARRVALELSAQAARERGEHARRLEAERARAADARVADRRALAGALRMLADVDARLNALADERAAKDRELEAAHGLVRTERRIADDIRALLAAHTNGRTASGG